jgi:peptidoglycan-associated lipoprotein
MNTIRIGIISILVTTMLAGCATTPSEQAGASVEDRGKPVGPQAIKPAKPSTDTTSKPLQDTPVAGNPLKDPGNILSRRSIFFDYDSDLIKDEFKPVVSAHARYLQQNPGAKMKIEGNADDRGSREYNLALGQRRADAVRQMMQLLGTKSGQVETVSFGEEKPRCTTPDEGCWSQNRRGDIVYQGE